MYRQKIYSLLLPGSVTTKMIARLALLIALEVVLTRIGSFTFMQTVRISLGFLPAAAAAAMYGPLAAGLCYAAGDVIGSLLFPIGAYFPGFTASAFLSGFIYGLCFYKKKPSAVRIAIGVLGVNVFINLLLDTYWLTFILGGTFASLAPLRLVRCAVMAPLSFVTVLAVWKTVKKIDTPVKETLHVTKKISDDILLAEKIEKKYKAPVLCGVTVSAGAGEIIGLAGENGSGKSTLLSVMAQTAKPDGGRVIICGENAEKNPGLLKRCVGYVPQENTLFEHLTVKENLKLWAAVYKTDWQNALPFLFPEDSDEKKESLLKKKAADLSGGTKKRLSIALALMHDPKLLLMDEPSASLDIGFKARLAELISGMKSRGRTVVFASHHPDELLLCDRIYVLKNGAFIYEGPPSGLGSGEGFTSALYALIKP